MSGADAGAVGSVFTTADAATHHLLYGAPVRLSRRTGALHDAKICGPDAAETLSELAVRVTPAGAWIADIGCGRGTSSVHLATRLTPRRLLLLDRSPALLDIAQARVQALPTAPAVAAMCADFHRLPLTPGCLDLAVAAFCLYHSMTPELVLAQIARALTAAHQQRDRHAVLVTKNLTSYAELDQLVAAVGLDPHAADRPSLYATFHSANAAAVAQSVFEVLDVVHEEHVFRFTSPRHLAAYLSTTPKYRLQEHLAGNEEALTAELARHPAAAELTMTSTVSYVLARASS